YKQKQDIINIILIGDKNIGKSKLIKQFTQNIFRRKKSQNTSLNIIYKYHNQTNEQKLHLKFHHINLTYQNKINLMSICSYADCLLLVYDINNQISFSHLIDRCLSLIQNYQTDHICSYSLIGIKYKNSRQINYSQIEIFVKKFKLSYYEISSLSNYEELLKDILDNYFEKKLKENSLFYLIKKINKLCDLYRL
ncbi:unnamed protein product, partial [Rotaria sp. Silwood1]